MTTARETKCTPDISAVDSPKCCTYFFMCFCGQLSKSTNSKFSLYLGVKRGSM